MKREPLSNRPLPPGSAWIHKLCGDEIRADQECWSVNCKEVVTYVVKENNDWYGLCGGHLLEKFGPNVKRDVDAAFGG